MQKANTKQVLADTKIDNSETSQSNVVKMAYEFEFLILKT